MPLIVSFFWKEPIRTERYSAKKQLDTLRSGGAFVFRSVEVRWMIVFAALIATTSKLWFFTYNPYFELVGIPLAEYGVIFFLLNIVAWLSSRYAYKTESYLGERRSIAGMILCVGVPILAMGLVPFQPLAYLVVVQNVVRGFMKPFVGDYLNRRIASNVRATVLSVQSAIANLIAIIGLALFGFLIAKFNVLHALAILGIASLTIGILSYRSYARRSEER